MHSLRNPQQQTQKITLNIFVTLEICSCQDPAVLLTPYLNQTHASWGRCSTYWNTDAIELMSTNIDETETNFLFLKISTTHWGRFSREHKNAAKMTSDEQGQIICHWQQLQNFWIFGRAWQFVITISIVHTPTFKWPKCKTI